MQNTNKTQSVVAVNTAQKVAKNKKMRSGFTLIEIVFVAVIIAVLAGLIIPKVLNNAKTSEYMSVAQEDLKTIKTAIGQYKTDGGQINSDFNTAALENYFPSSIINTGQNDAAGVPLYTDKNAKIFSFSVNNDGTSNFVTLKPAKWDDIDARLKQKILAKIKKDFECADGSVDDNNQEIYGKDCKF